MVNVCLDFSTTEAQRRTEIGSLLGNNCRKGDSGVAFEHENWRVGFRVGCHCQLLWVRPHERTDPRRLNCKRLIRRQACAEFNQRNCESRFLNPDQAHAGSPLSAMSLQRW